jgi:carboxylesterase
MAASEAAPYPFYSGPEHSPFTLGEGPRRALLIHGFPGTPAEMRPLGQVLAAGGWQARGLLLPGMGAEIMHLAQMRASDWMDAARAGWEEVRREDPGAILVGNSMGAAVALRLAAEAPGGRLVLVSPFWDIGALGALLPVAKYLVRSVAPFSRANFGDPALRAELQRMAPGIDLDDPATQQEIRTQMKLPTAVLDQVRLMGRAAYAAAPRVHAPALVLQGTYDRIVRRGATRRLLVRLGGPVTYCELPAAHELVLLGGAAADRAALAVRAFLPEAGAPGGALAAPAPAPSPAASVP